MVLGAAPFSLPLEPQPLPSFAHAPHRRDPWLPHQWTSSLDVLEEIFFHLDIKYLRSDGAVQAVERQRRVDDFSTDPSIKCFLLSTRACGLGINLTAADTVILHDVDFNPAIDQQAIDRAHRMGQSRPVRVIKLATLGTVDERVLAVADQKALHQRALLGGPSVGGRDNARDSDSAGLMGSILRDVLLPREAPAPHAHEEGARSDSCGDSGENMVIQQVKVAKESDIAHTMDETPEEGEVGYDKAAVAGYCHKATQPEPQRRHQPMLPVPACEEEIELAHPGPRRHTPTGKETQVDMVAPSETEDGRIQALRSRILARLPAYEELEMSLKEVLAELSEHVGYDVKAAGLKAHVKRIIAEADDV